MDTLTLIKNKFGIDLEQKLPITLPIDRFSGLCELFTDLGFKTGVEIGVANGKYSKWICTKNRGVKLFCIDPYLSYGEYVECHKSEDQAKLDQQFEDAKQRMAQFNCEFIRKTSMEAVKDFQDNSLDFVFIDGNHTFQYIVNDIAEWEKKVRPGGIISGHDYWRSIESKKPLYIQNLTFLERLKLVQVKDAVNGWTYANRIKPWFLTTDHCWMYVKV